MILARAPFRIPLGGGGTDLPSYYSKHGGFILSAAINKYLYIYVNRPAADDFIRVKYSHYEQVSTPDEVQHDLVRPSLKLLNLAGSLEVVSMADVPGGTGLGSSSTYLVALLTALYELKRERVPTQALAEAACHIEMDLAAHPVGKQDHYLAAFGGITCLEIGPDGKVKVTPLDISISAVEDFRNNVLLFYTGVTRSADGILQSQQLDTQREDPTVVDSLHRTKELGYRIKETLQSGSSR
jgi:D-glycero-alpha-D-manno-heptose-7-phosphate kinase